MFQMHPLSLESKNGLRLATARQFNNRRKGGKGGKGGKSGRNDRFESRKGVRFEGWTNDRRNDRRNDRDEKSQYLPLME